MYLKPLSFPIPFASYIKTFYLNGLFVQLDCQFPGDKDNITSLGEIQCLEVVDALKEFVVDDKWESQHFPCIFL